MPACSASYLVAEQAVTELLLLVANTADRGLGAADHPHGKSSLSDALAISCRSIRNG